MIQKVLVVTNSGLSIFYHDFTENVVNPQLVAGFTSAINSFSEQIIVQGQNIESLQMSNLKMRISTFLNNSIHMILFHNLYDPDEIVDSIIFDLELQFIEQFGQLEVYEFAEISRFHDFKPIVKELCKTRIDIGIISHQSELKKKIWRELFAESNPLEQSTEWNVFQFSLEKYPHVQLSLWNFDYEGFNHNITLLQQKQILYFVIEANFNQILSLIKKIKLLKKQNPRILIVGLYVGESNLVEKFAEIVLQIPIFSFNTIEDISNQTLLDVIHKSIIGV